MVSVSEGQLDEEHWALHYPACGGTRQSPINLQRRKVHFNPALTPLELMGYEEGQAGQFPMTNNGHTGKGRLWGGGGIGAEAQTPPAPSARLA